MQIQQNDMSSHSSQSPESRGPQPQTKSKQERIRDNQRRSRARRQEYLAELERQLEQCRSASRDAMLQREYILEVQIENTRLRELCSLAGYNDQIVEQYVSRGHAQAVRYSQDSNPALRAIKPKIEPVDTGRLLQSNVNAQGIITQSGSRRPSTILSATSSLGPDRTLASTPSSAYGPLTPVNGMPISPMPQANMTGFDWVYATNQALPQNQLQEQDEQHYFSTPTQLPPQALSGTFACDGFGPQTTHIPQSRNEYTTPNALPKQVLDQYSLAAVDMDQVDNMLTQGQFQPAFTGAQAIDSQAMFQVMNKLDGYSFGGQDN